MFLQRVCGVKVHFKISLINSVISSILYSHKKLFLAKAQRNFTQRIHKKRIPGAFAPYVLFA